MKPVDMANASEVNESKRHWLNIYRLAKAEIKRNTEIANEAKAELLDGWSTETGLVAGSPAFQYIEGTAKKLDTDKLKAEYPDVYEACRKESSTAALYLLGDQ